VTCARTCVCTRGLHAYIGYKRKVGPGYDGEVLQCENISGELEPSADVTKRTICHEWRVALSSFFFLFGATNVIAKIKIRIKLGYLRFRERKKLEQYKNRFFFFSIFKPWKYEYKYFYTNRCEYGNKYKTQIYITNVNAVVFIQ